MTDKFNLERFKAAQDVCYHRVKAELSAGHKRSHWIWFVFPQITGLGQSSMDANYAIKSIAEAKAYLSDPLLSARLYECIELLLHCGERDILSIMTRPDDLKLCSSMTLFAEVAEDDTPFRRVLNSFYEGKSDPMTLNILADMSS
jgi:uncharacterized protein (DUF1810 family)